MLKSLFVCFFERDYLRNWVLLSRLSQISTICQQILSVRPPGNEGAFPTREQRQRKEAETPRIRQPARHGTAEGRTVAALREDAPPPISTPPHFIGHGKSDLRGAGPAGRRGLVLPSQQIDADPRIRRRF